MRKLDLKDYTVNQKVMNPVSGGSTSIEIPYFVKDSILALLFQPSLELRGPTLIKQNILAMKIEGADNEVLLEEEEWGRLVTAANKYPAQQRADVTLIDRILNQTPMVEIETKSEKV